MTASDGSVADMHVLLVSNRFEARGGGTEVFTHDLAHALLKRSIQVSWLAVDEGSMRSPLDGVRRIALSTPLGNAYPRDWRRREARQARHIELLLTGLPTIDAIHVTHFSRIGLDFLECSALKRVPASCTLTDYAAVCADYQLRHRPTGRLCHATAPSARCVSCLAHHAGESESGEEGAAPGSQSVEEIDSWRRRNLSWLAERCAAVWVQTPYQRQELISAGLDPAKLVRDIAAYAVPEPWYPLKPEVGDPQKALFLGRASSEKGLHILLAAFRSWGGAGRLRLITLPDDLAYEQRLRGLAAEDPRVEWLAPMTRNQLGSVLAEARALIVPSQWYENHPLVIHYALALGVPVVCSALPSLRHLSALGDVQYVSPYDDLSAWTAALTQLFGTPPAPRRNRSEEFARGFEDLVDEIVAVYRAHRVA